MAVSILKLRNPINRYRDTRVAKYQAKMSFSLNDAAMAGNVEEVMIRLNMGEDVNQKCFPR